MKHVKKRVSGVVDVLESTYRKQAYGRGNLLRGRLGGSALWLMCNLLALAVGFVQLPDIAFAPVETDAAKSVKARRAAVERESASRSVQADDAAESDSASPSPDKRAAEDFKRILATVAAGGEPASKSPKTDNSPSSAGQGDSASAAGDSGSLENLSRILANVAAEAGAAPDAAKADADKDSGRASRSRRRDLAARDRRAANNARRSSARAATIAAPRESRPPRRDRAVSMVGSVAVGQGFFAIVLLTPLMCSRAAVRKKKLLIFSEFMLWLMTGVLFMLAAAYSERLSKPDTFVALFAGAMLFISGGVLARAAAVRVRMGRRRYSSGVSAPVAIALSSVFGGLAVLVVLAGCGLFDAARIWASLYPLTLVSVLANSGAAVPTIPVAVGVLVWILVVPFVAAKYTRWSTR